MRIVANVISGRGWASRDCNEEVVALSNMEGSKFVAGSLNLVANSPVWLDVESVAYRNGIRAFWRARLDDVPVMIERSLGSHPVHIFEIFAAVRLRDVLGLNDGDQVALDIPPEIIDVDRDRWRNRLVWDLFWKYREASIYRNDWYWSFFSNGVIRRHAWRSMQ